MRRRTTKLYGRTRARKIASKPSWSSVKKEYGISRTVYKTFAAVPCNLGLYINPSWNNENNAYWKTRAMGLRLGTIGILKASTKFQYFKEQFDEFRVAAIQYTFTATNKYKPGDIDDKAYWPHSFQSMITSYDRNAALSEEYIAIDIATADGANNSTHVGELANTMLAEPSCVIKTVSAGNQLQQTVTLTPTSKQHYNWISTSFSKTENGTEVYAQLLNQIFNPQVKCVVLTDPEIDVQTIKQQFIAVQIEIRLECRGAKLGMGQLQ